MFRCSGKKRNKNQGEAFGSVPTDSLYYLCTMRVRISTNNTMLYQQLGIPDINRDRFRSSENDVQLKLDYCNTIHPHTCVIFMPLNGVWGSTRRAGHNTLYSFRSWEEES